MCPVFYPLTVNPLYFLCGKSISSGRARFVQESLATATHYIWNDEEVKMPPAKRVVIFKYPEVEKAILNFTADFAQPGSSRTYLDPAKPLVINGKNVKIPDIPSNPSDLRLVERSGLDVTSLLQNSAKGKENNIEVNYIVDKKSIIHKNLGRLTMSLVVTTPEKIVAARYCFFCGASNRVEASQCARCGKRLEVGGVETTVCSNPACQATIPLRGDIKFCDKCGTLQETATQKLGTKNCVKCGAPIDKDAVFCSKCGTAQ
jgi:ribosomal protein L40E